MVQASSWLPELLQSQIFKVPVCALAKGPLVKPFLHNDVTFNVFPRKLSLQFRVVYRDCEGFQLSKIIGGGWLLLSPGSAKLLGNTYRRQSLQSRFRLWDFFMSQNYTAELKGCHASTRGVTCKTSTIRPTAAWDSLDMVMADPCRVSPRYVCSFCNPSSGNDWLAKYRINVQFARKVSHGKLRT